MDCGEICNFNRGWRCKKEKKMIAFQSALGTVSRFIQRYLITNPCGTWTQLKTKLAVIFSDVTDAKLAFPYLGQLNRK